MPSIHKIPSTVLASATALAITPDDAQQLEPVVQTFVDSLTGPPRYTLTPDAARAVLSSVQTTLCHSMAQSSNCAGCRKRCAWLSHVR
jgi:hypothetical protein